MAEFTSASGDQEDLESEEEIVKLKPSHHKQTHCTQKALLSSVIVEPVSLDLLKIQTGVTDVQLDQECSHEDLDEISHQIGNYTLYTIPLGLTPAEVSDIHVNPQWNYKQKTEQMLLTWRSNSSAPTYRRLVTVALKVGDGEVAHQLCEMCASLMSQSKIACDSQQAKGSVHSISPLSTPLLTDSTPNSAPQEMVQRLSSYRDYLQSRYRVQNFTSSTQWPPVSTNKVFKLAMIQKERVQRGRIDDDFVRLTITGKIDDILARKVPVDLENIFSDTASRRKLVLIEGAPGSGKSTLALHICQEWGEGKLFHDYNVVVLVRLRNPLVREAKTIEDLLPCRNSTMAQEVGSDLLATDGRGVLWVLDGWDELPPGLCRDSIIHKLLQPGISQESPLHECTLIITSRPSSSANLHPLASSRVEVLGFTPDELEQYFTECLKGDSHAVKNLLDRIRENPVVEGSCYLPLNASIVAHTYLSEDHSLPTSNHGIFSSVVQCTLNRYLQDRLGKTTQIMNITSPDSLPPEIQTSFTHLCTLAFCGIEKNRVTFTDSDLTALSIPTDVCDIGLLQSVPSIISSSRQFYFCFLHLSIQELLAAIHISKMSPKQQISVFQNLFGNPRFSAVFQFYAGITKLRTSRPWLSILPRFLRPVSASIFDLVRKVVRHSDGFFGQPKRQLVSLFHCLYEAEDTTLCVFVDNLLNHRLSLYRDTLIPLDCLSVGYFLSVVSTTTSGIFTAGLTNCSIGDQGCKFLMKGLCKCVHSYSNTTSQLDLYLNDNRIHEEGAHHIAKLLKTTSLVCILRFGSNRIGDSGLKSLCEALSTNTTLEELDLHSCSLTISDENGLALCELLTKNCSLKSLNLSFNRITDCCHIATGLMKNSSLTALDLSYCELTDEGLNDLAAGLNNYLEKLDIGGNRSITVNGINTFSRHLTTLSGLRDFRIPFHLRSSITAIDVVNEERWMNGLSEIAVDGRPTYTGDGGLLVKLL